MDKEMLIKAIADTKKKVSEAFQAYLDGKGASAEEKEHLTALKGTLAELQEELAQIEREEGGTDPMNEDRKPGQQLSEEVMNFLKDFREKVNLGAPWSGELPKEVSHNIVMKKQKLARVRKYCTNEPASGDYLIVVEGKDFTIKQIGAGGTFGEEDVDLGTIELSAVEFGGIAKINKNQINDYAIDLLGYIEDKFAKAFAKAEDNEILFGKGTASSRSTGVRGVHTNMASDNIVTAAGQDTVTWAEVKQTIQKLKSYRSGATVFMGWELHDIIHDLKDDAGNYIFPDQNKLVERILGCPVEVVDNMPALEAGATAMICGDFSYYHVCDREGISFQFLNELYAKNGRKGVLGSERFDGEGLPEAFSELKLGMGA